MAIGLLILIASPTRADDQADAKKIIDKAIKAVGDEAKIRQMKGSTWKAKGTFHGMGNAIPYTGDYAVVFPDKFRMNMDFDANGQKFQFSLVYNSGKGWIRLMDNTIEMDADRLASQKETMYAGTVAKLIGLNDKAYTLTPLGETKVDKTPAVGVRVSRKDHKDVNLYFDKEKGFLIKSEFRIKDDQGQEVNQETFYSDYKETDGLKAPSKLTIKRDGTLYVEGESFDFKYSESLDDKLFKEP
jgi:hypothetical protein